MSGEDADLEQLRRTIRRLRLAALGALVLAVIAVLLSVLVLALAAREALWRPTPAAAAAPGLGPVAAEEAGWGTGGAS
jgi:hypothetical protein